ncbi:MAG: DUF2007 domain-containing protein [Bacteroidota bacterium]|nr:DUF2007 domain-containing protein [Bacteroidota bacterium]
MEEDWVMVFSSAQRYLVDIYHDVLEDADIESVVVDKKDSMYLLGAVELYVRVENAFIAKQLIEKGESE